MKKILYLFIFLTITCSSTYSFSQNINTTNTEREISNIIHNTYIKEINIVYNLRKIIQQCKNYSNVLRLLKIHQENTSTLKKIMEQYSLKIPTIKLDKSKENTDCNHIFQEIIKIEKELLKLYNEGLHFFHTLPKNETIGVIIEKFEKLKNRLENEDYYVISNDM